jgi:hypothetical protein
MARRQHGVLAGRDLEALGFSPMAIDHRVATGRLHLISRGVYAVGRPDLTPHGRWVAAVLACGDLAVLSHRSAAELWGIGWEEDHRIDVTIRRSTKIARSGIKVRRRPKLPERSVVRRFGIPVTNPIQTLIDLATELKPLRLERAVNQADVHDLVDPETLRRSLDAYVGMPGAKTLWTMLDRHTFRLSDSDLEIYFRPRARAAGGPVSRCRSPNNGSSASKSISTSSTTASSSRPTGCATTGPPRSRPAWSNATRRTPRTASASSASPTGRSPTRRTKSPRS